MSERLDWIPSSADLGKPSAARAYDYLLGGTLNFGVDRDFVVQMMAVQPEIKRAAIMNRAFLRRAVLFLIGQGVRQFLDLGSGVPTVGNVHEIAQQAVPDSKVVYVDIERVAVAHSQLLLKDNDNAAVVHADITDPERVLGDRATRDLLDFDEPIGILGITIGHYIGDDAASVFRAYRDAVVPGSYLALTHLANDLLDYNDVTEAMRTQSNSTIVTRGKAEIAELFGDWALVEPGLVTTSRWRPELDDGITDEIVKADSLYAGVAVKN